MSSRVRTASVVALVALLTASGLGILPALPHAAASGAPSALHASLPSVANVRPIPSSALPQARAAPSSVAPSDPGTLAAHAALAAAKAAGVSPRDVFVPRASASAAQLARAAVTDLVAPLYNGTPAPLGIADFGLAAGPHGSVVPSVLQTSSVQGTVNATSVGISGGDLFQSSPDSYGIQLNAVTTNVTLFGHGGYSFWTQNVVEFFPSAGFMVLVTNVWNFSSPSSFLSPNVFFSHGPFGHQVGTTFYFAETVLPVALSYPLTITLTMTSNTTVDSGTGAARDSVYFTVGLSGPSVTSNFAGPLSMTYDYVVFNSAPASNPHKVVAASDYTADGSAYNPVGLTNDFELIFGGPGGGSHVDLTSADATLGLDYWNGSAYAAVPSSFNYGGETGETASGVTIGWSNASGGPTGFPLYGTMREGPTILEGLWNTTTSNGTFPVTFNMTPSNAWVVLTSADDSNFTIPEPSAASGALGDTFYLPPGDYSALVELSDYAPVRVNFSVDDTPVTLNVSLAANPSWGLYTPLWATSNAQLAAISSAGNGTPANPYRLDTAPNASLGPAFGEYNDFTFPVTPGLFLWNTNASVVVDHEAMFSTTTNRFTFPGHKYLPLSNNLQWWFWNVSHVAVANTTFSGGWFGQNTFAPVSFDTFNAIFYASSDNLLWNDTFDTPGQGLLMFQGGTLFGPSTGGGGGNVVWGSTFQEQVFAPHCPAFPICEPLFPYAFGLGLQIAEGNDTIFNNYVATPTTAWELPLNMYSSNPELFVNSFNITPATIHPTLTAFPGYPFTGANILGGPNQGGNFWWDYGSTLNPYNGADNPLGTLPYVENATTLLPQVLGCDPYYCATYIYPGGDRAPLTDGLVAQNLAATGVPRFAPWFVTFPTPNGSRLPALQAAAGVGGGPNVQLLIAPGSYALGAANGQILRSGSPLTVSTGALVTLRFSLAAGYGYLYFRESGLPHGAASPPWPFTVPTWSSAVEVAPGFFQASSSNLPVIGWLLPQGMYNFTIPGIPNFYASTGNQRVTLAGSAANVAVHFTLQRYTVLFTESGLAAGKAWSLVATGTVLGHTKRFSGHSTSPTIALQLPNGTFSFSVRPVRGYTLNGTGAGSVVVSGGAANTSVVFTPFVYAVTFTETGLPASTNWSVTIGAVTRFSTGTSITFLETNGTYSYSLGAVAGHSGTARPALAHVAGAPVAIAVTFT